MKQMAKSCRAYLYTGTLAQQIIIQFLFSLALSWVYAITAQMILPIYPVVITVLPLPIYLLVFYFGAPGAYGFILYLLQGIMGAPFFAHMRSGWQVIVGPSGGYLVGMAVVAILLAVIFNFYSASWKRTLFVLIISEFIVLGLGLLQLSFFVSSAVLLATGLYPFILGEFLKVVVTTITVLFYNNH